MARIKKKRLVQMAPCFGGFKPFGVLNEKRSKVMINIEEYEALKLCDYEHLTQAEDGRINEYLTPYIYPYL